MRVYICIKMQISHGVSVHTSRWHSANTALFVFSVYLQGREETTVLTSLKISECGGGSGVGVPPQIKHSNKKMISLCLCEEKAGNI